MRFRVRAGVGILMLTGCGVLWAQAPPSAAPASAAPSEDIRDIRGPKPVWLLAESAMWPLTLGAVLLVASGYGLWRFSRRRTPTRVLEPHEIALQQLEDARRTLNLSTGREFGGTVSDIVRRYLEQQFRVTVTQRTTPEFLQDLLSSSSTPLAQRRALLSAFLQQSDLIKFAGDELSLQSLESLLQSARQLVQATATDATNHAALPAT